MLSYINITAVANARIRAISARVGDLRDVFIECSSVLDMEDKISVESANGFAPQIGSMIPTSYMRYRSLLISFQLKRLIEVGDFWCGSGFAEPT